jgi:SAM-dependent methyltransferase
VVSAGFDDLVAEARAQPVDTWSFAWLDGRATEARPSWRYFDVVARAAAGSERMLDVETGTGNLVADLPKLPTFTVATDAHPPSIAVAGPRLRVRGAQLVAATPSLPFRSAAFDLVVSRHPVATDWWEIARVLVAGGRFVTQQIGPDSLRDLSAWMLGPRPPSSNRDPERARRAAERAGLTIDRLEVERTPVAFYDIGAVVYFLRLVPWIVPAFSVDRFRAQLHALHVHIERVGSFSDSSSRFLLDARRS